jgi:hypothetical protein
MAKKKITGVGVCCAVLLLLVVAQEAQIIHLTARVEEMTEQLMHHEAFMKMLFGLVNGG